MRPVTRWNDWSQKVFFCVWKLVILASTEPIGEGHHIIYLLLMIGTEKSNRAQFPHQLISHAFSTLFGYDRSSERQHAADQRERTPITFTLILNQVFRFFYWWIIDCLFVYTVFFCLILSFVMDIKRKMFWNNVNRYDWFFR